MSFLHPFSFPITPSNTTSNTSRPTSSESSHHSEGHASFMPFIPSPPRGLAEVDLNESQFEEVIFDTQFSKHQYYDQFPSIHVSPSSQQHTCEASNLRPENMGSKRRRKASIEGGTTTKNASGKFHWDPKSTLVLIEVKRAHDEARFHAGIGGKAKTLEEQWVDIASSMASRGTFVEWRVANDKWKRLTQIHKEIADWERNIPSGKSSYWQMSPRERKEEAKFGHLNFDRDIFDAMERHFGRDPVVNPPPSVIDTTNSLHHHQRSQGSPTPMSTAAAPSESMEEGINFEHTPDNSGVQKKTRKRTQTYDVGLKEATKDITVALGAAEDSRDRRHQEMLVLNKEAVQCNKDMVRIESQKVEMGFQFAAGIRSLVDSLKEIADSLRKQ